MFGYLRFEIQRNKVLAIIVVVVVFFFAEIKNILQKSPKIVRIKNYFFVYTVGPCIPT